MDVLRPQLMWTKDGRCYRINDSMQISSSKISAAADENSGYVEDELYGDDEPEDYEVEETTDHRFRTRFHVPQALYGQLIGSKGSIKQRLEIETKTIVKIPKPGGSTDIIIIGAARQNVVTARRRMEVMVLAARNKHPFTHFLSVPIYSSDIRDTFVKFKKEVLDSYPTSGVNDTMFQNPKKLHITIGTMTLLDDQDRVLAAEALKECEETIIKPITDMQPEILIHLKGIEYMNDDPSAVDVLYGKVNSGPLQAIANQIVDLFVAKGLMQRKYDNVKLHVTVINSLFRDGDEDNEKPRTSFDARAIIGDFENYSFGTQMLKEIHLSQRFSSANDGYFMATADIKI